MNKPWIDNKMAEKFFSKYKKTQELKKADDELQGLKKADDELQGLKKADDELQGLKKEENELQGLKKEKNELQELKKEENELQGLKKEKNELQELKKEENELQGLKKEKNELQELKKEENELQELKKEENEPKGLKKEDNLHTELKIGSIVRSMVVKTPFSTVAEVSSFSNSPILSNKDEEVFVFHSETNKVFYELDTKLLATVHHYHEEPYCCLVSSKLFEKRVLLELPNQEDVRYIENDNMEQSLWVPMHNLISKQRKDSKSSNYITTKLPIEIGKYKTEISLQEIVMFKEKVTRIKKVSQEIILTESKVLLSEAINVKQNSVMIEKGILLVEGYVLQHIEYTVEKNTPQKKMYQLMQNMVLELIVQVLQEQDVQVEII
ncbi:BC_2427 family protein [Bacillus sp. NPDC094106]|uniref:BC_2427 family protein n=1 Tax=Bacillus sp. NPDC094106 TaxID=3363949 RepID=UPI0037FEC725